MEYNANPVFSRLTPAERRAAMRPGDPDILAVLTIDEDDIDGELRDVAANLAYWAFQLHQARAGLRRAKASRDRLSGQLDPIYRAELREDGAKKPTNDQVRARIHQDPEYLDAQAEVADVDQRAADLAVICDGIRVKADCLRSLSANKRAELEALRTAT
jgi:hypothetical protein